MRLVADANVLLSAVIGGRARVVLEHPGVAQVVAAEATLAEVKEYAGHLAKKKRLALDVVLLTLAVLPVTVVERAAYASAIPEAKRRIAHRDPDDVEVLALAIELGLPVWSNDRDFDETGVEWYTTAELLKKLSA